ncbi:MAG: DUF2213 domain-containing protein [Lachnospiraceae bacterium]|nr:DUF2213 domain-containing protein [Lachnospiraceae bacterium]
MLAYYGYTISPNQIETGEGFLICRNVPIARIGDMEYGASELGLSGAGTITVHRSSEEVFAPEAIASFEGKPVTNDHPPELLNPDSVSMYEEGHAQTIRQGTGEWEGYLIADLHIHNRGLIQAVQGGKREISCGYECEYVENGDGTYSQKNIRGNHIAVVNRGRAGRRAAILDSDTKKSRKARRPERKDMKKTGILLKLFGMSVKDKSPEEIEQMAMDTADALDMAGTAKMSGEPEAGQGKPDVGDNQEKKDARMKAAVKDAAFFDALNEKVDKLLALLDKEPEKKEEDKGEKDPMDAAIEELEGRGEDEKKKPSVIPAGDEQSLGVMDKAVAAAILKQVRPSVAAIKDEKERKAVSDALIACVTGNLEDDTAKIIRAAQKNARRAADSAPKMDLDAIQKAYDSQNPHRKENK